MVPGRIGYVNSLFSKRLQGVDEIFHWKNNKKKHTSNNFSPEFKEDLKAVSNFRQFNFDYSELSIKRTGCNNRTGGKILSK